MYGHSQLFPKVRYLTENTVLGFSKIYWNKALLTIQDWSKSHGKQARILLMESPVYFGDIR